jgi:hypothetical protein
VRGYVEGADFVVEESPHGEPIEGLVPTPADAAVVHVRGHGDAQTLLVPSAISEAHEFSISRRIASRQRPAIIRKTSLTPTPPTTSYR